MQATPLTVFYDGACPVCSAEMPLLQGEDRHQRIVLDDVSGEAGRDGRLGVSQQALLDCIHAVTVDGPAAQGRGRVRAGLPSRGTGPRRLGHGLAADALAGRALYPCSCGTATASRPLSAPCSGQGARQLRLRVQAQDALKSAARPARTAPVRIQPTMPAPTGPMRPKRLAPTSSPHQTALCHPSDHRRTIAMNAPSSRTGQPGHGHPPPQPGAALPASCAAGRAGTCASPRAQEFWWRVVHVLGVSGSLLLVMLFVSRPDGTHDLMSVMRQTLAFSAGRIFFSVAMVARRIDHAVKGRRHQPPTKLRWPAIKHVGPEPPR